MLYLHLQKKFRIEYCGHVPMFLFILNFELKLRTWYLYYNKKYFFCNCYFVFFTPFSTCSFGFFFYIYVYKVYFHVNFCSKLDCDVGTVVPLARACRSRCEQDGGRRDGWRICNRFYVRPYRPSGAARNQINKTSIGSILDNKKKCRS